MSVKSKEAIQISKQYITELYEGEELTNIGLEEIEYHEVGSYWTVTLGFSRPWNSSRSQSKASKLLSKMEANSYSDLKRTYKVITVNSNGAAISMKNREVDQSK